MACYAAVLSLYHTLNNIIIHPRPPISLDQNQVESLAQNLTYFQHFLECYSSEEDEDLESRIIAACYAAEDLIETLIVDRIRARSKSEHGEKIMSSSSRPRRHISISQDLRRKVAMVKCKVNTMRLGKEIEDRAGLRRVIKEMDLIKREVAEIIQEKIMTPHLQTYSSGVPAAASTWQSSITPVFNDGMITQVLDKLTGQQSGLQIIPIVGMGGIGKTTFATTLYKNPLIVQHFDTLAWVTISQEYSRRNILQLFYKEIKGNTSGLSEMSEDEIGLILYQHLWVRRYLIVMDDMWSVEAWDTIKSFFPENNDGSRIMITTRLSNLAFQLSACHVFQMQFLDEYKSWDLLCEIVFGKLDCPIELENIGKEIVKKCRGLPLSIAVIGGLLRKSNMTQAYWIYTVKNLNSLISLENDEYTLRILRTSYTELPVHLKPCFLYMGIFPEDDEIKVSMLIKLWVAEGILKPINDKSSEEVGKEYLKELINRNLILISELRWDGEARSCGLHDFLREVCLREAQKQKLFCLLRQHKDPIPHVIHMERRICINTENKWDKYSPEFLRDVETASLTRSLLYRVHLQQNTEEVSPSLRFTLLRVYSPIVKYEYSTTCSNNAIFEQANLRYLSLKLGYRYAAAAMRLVFLCSLLWNLQTLKVDSPNCIEMPIIASKIWGMPLLRHVTFYESVLPDPPNGEDSFVLENLQTLRRIKNFKLREEVIKRIPNVKKLHLIYGSDGLDDEELPDFCLHNLGRLQKLESLTVRFINSDHCDLENVRRNLGSFPHSLKKLTLSGTKLSWEELTVRIGSLPLLQFLKLKCDACMGPEWETIEGQFCSLRILQIEECYDLKYWETDSSHFPRLEHLLLQHLPELEEIPSSIGDIPTMKSVRLEYCNRSAADSAKRIKKEQEECGNEDLHVVINGQMSG